MKNACRTKKPALTKKTDSDKNKENEPALVALLTAFSPPRRPLRKKEDGNGDEKPVPKENT